ncbi:hypothetical protein Scep_004460 [Stephania cephalantha]|uniref:Uncharacterized protein n=1 Tax=Stephania cephalantha TaxID=152367 RepID=A0AAP0PZ45_9MAGN
MVKMDTRDLGCYSQVSGAHIETQVSAFLDPASRGKDILGDFIGLPAVKDQLVRANFDILFTFGKWETEYILYLYILLFSIVAYVQSTFPGFSTIGIALLNDVYMKMNLIVYLP